MREHHERTWTFLAIVLQAVAEQGANATPAGAQALHHTDQATAAETLERLEGVAPDLVRLRGMPGDRVARESVGRAFHTV